MSTFKNQEQKREVRAQIESAISSVLASVAADTEGVSSYGLRLTLDDAALGSRRVEVELHTDRYGHLNYGGKFTSIQLTLDPWSGSSVRRAVKVDGTTLPEGAEAKIEAKARELVAIAQERAASERRRQEAADARKVTAVAARRAAQAEGFEPRHQHTGAVVDLDAALALYSFAEKPNPEVQVQHASGSSRVTLDLTFPADEAGLMKALVLAGNIQALVEEVTK